jgi:type I restriction enzyme M protein
MNLQENKNGANLGFEEKLWQAADKLRNNMDAAEYKHVVLGLLFLKYISDAFEEKHADLLEDEYADPEDRDEYTAENIFWVSKDARWTYIKENAKKPTIGQIIDDAMVAIEKDNPQLKGVLPKDYARPALDKTRLGELIDILSFKVGDRESRSQDVLGRVYEYFLAMFASAEGKNGGEFYTPQCVVKLLAEMIEPLRGRIYDPCCGSGGMFVQSERFVQAHQGKIGDISIYGQESNPTTWRLCKMNLAIRGIDGNIGKYNADTFHNDLHKKLKADYILANPPFNVSDWGGERLTDDVRWSGYGIPPVGNANYAWILHMLWHLAPSGVAGFVLANGSMSTSITSEAEIREKLVEKDNVDCIVTLPGKLFYSTQIPVCLWFITKNKAARVQQIEEAREMLLNYRTASTPVGIVTGAGRAGQRVVISDLAHFLDEEIDMFSLVIIGSSQSYVKEGRMITPRGYQISGGEKS